jgi:thiol-disulfide isomerase/thioredoxin
MMKCRICGKRFETRRSLEDHHRSAHPNARFVPPGPRISRTLLVLIIVVLVASSGVVAYLIYSQSTGNSGGQYSALLGTTISETLYLNLTSVSPSTLASIGIPQGTTAPSSISASQMLGPNSKPEVLYIGAEWCPYCAAERWSLIVALSRFGNFTGLTYMESSSSDIFPNTVTFSFLNSTYVSPYISFVAIEHQDRNRNTLVTPSSQEQNLWGQYTVGSDTIPFIYFDGQYYLSGAQFQPSAIANLNWTQIASQLNNPQSSVAQAVDGSANQLVSTICNSLQSKLWPVPKSVCG